MGYSFSPAHLDDYNGLNKTIGMRKSNRHWRATNDRQLELLWPQPYAALAAQMGFSARTIQKAVDRLGLQRPKPGRPKGTPENRERDEEIKRLRGAGMSEGALMDRYGLSARRIHQILYGNGKKE